MLPAQVLVVDDSPSIRELLTLMLSHKGYRVLTATDGRSAQILLQAEQPALIISDLEMPDGDGWGMLTYCHGQHPGLPVLIVSGASWGLRPDIEIWAAGHLTKPFEPKHLEAEIERLLRPAA